MNRRRAVRRRSGRRQGRRRLRRGRRHEVLLLLLRGLLEVDGEAAHALGHVRHALVVIVIRCDVVGPAGGGGGGGGGTVVRRLFCL